MTGIEDSDWAGGDMGQWYASRKQAEDRETADVEEEEEACWQRLDTG